MSRDGSLRIQSHNDGFVGVFQTLAGDEKVKRELKGSFGNVYFVKFFPSGKVALTGGADTIIRIWDLLDAQENKCAATLKNVHNQAITSIEIIEKGRNILSASKDGSIVLWDVSSQTHIVKFCPELGPIKSLSINSTDLFGEQEKNLVDQKEVGTDSKILIACSETGHVFAYDLRSRDKIISLTTTSSIESCIIVKNGSYIMAGTEEGKILIWDTRKILSNDVQLSQPLTSFQLSNTSITCINSYDLNNSAWISTMNGTAHKWNFNLMKPTIQISGSDEPLYALASSKTNLFTGSRDGIVRVYDCEG